jgi:hypothetical protein
MASLPNDEHNPKRVFTDPRIQCLVEQGDIGGALVLDPLLQIAAGEDDVVHTPARLGNVGLEAWLSNVQLAGFLNGFCIVFQAASALVSGHNASVPT